MKVLSKLFTLAVLGIAISPSSAQTGKPDPSPKKAGGENLYIDVHQFKPGTVTYADVAKAHARDLAVEGKYDTHFLEFWVNEEKGLVYCLSSTSDSSLIRKTHSEAHGLMPEYIYQVTDGEAAKLKGHNNFYLDVHYLGEGNVTAKAVADAHKKDLAVEGKYGVNFINYWVDVKDGVVMCLSQAKDSAAVVNTHKEAHGLLPTYVLEVKQGK
jgi:hypothetical protein